MENPLDHKRRSSYLTTKRKFRFESYRTRKRLFIIFLNSTSLFIIAFLLVYLFNQLITMGVAKLLGIDSTLRYYEIYYHIPNNSPLWTLPRVIAVSIFSPIITLIAGSMLLFLVKESRKANYGMLLLFWTGCHSINYFLGGVIAGVATGRGMGYPLDYALWPHIDIYLAIGLVCGMFLSLVGYTNSSRFLKISPSRFWTKRKYRRIFTIYTLILPWLIGLLVFFIIEFPDRMTQHENIFMHSVILLFSMILLLTPIVFYNKPVHFKTEDQKDNVKRKLPIFGLPLLAVLAVIAYRLLLSESFQKWLMG